VKESKPINMTTGIDEEESFKIIIPEAMPIFNKKIGI
jgi:hypothetical protein